MIFLAVYYWTTDEALAAAGALDGKIIIDATNPYIRTDDGQIQWVPGVSSALELAQKAPHAKVVKAYNTLPTTTFATEHHRSEPYALFYCGDDADAKAIAAQLFDSLDTLEQVLCHRCQVLCGMRSKIRVLTNYHWQPEPELLKSG